MQASIMDRRKAMADRHRAWKQQTLDGYLAEAASAFENRLLVITDEETLTYRQALDASLRVAQLLDHSGIGPGDKVGIIMPNIPVAASILFGIWRRGAVVVPINTLYREDELAFVVGQSDAKLILTVTDYQGQDFLAQLDTIIPAWRSGDYQPHRDLRQILVLGEPRDRPWSFERALDRAVVATDHSASLSRPDQPAVIMYTSGTTGVPKGVVQTHDNLLRAAYAGAYHKGFEAGRRAIFSLPLYHVFGLVVGLLSSLVVGGAIIPLPRFDARRMLTAIERHRATYLMAVPTMSIALLDEAGKGTYDLSSLNTVHNASALTPTWVWQALKDRFGVEEIFTSYGQTETTATIVCTLPGDDLDTLARYVGKPVEGGVAGIAALGGIVAEFKTVDPATLEDLPRGSVGEICTRGPMNATGYYNNGAETERLFLPDGWLRTGDIGAQSPDGYFQLSGRTKELYKSGGELVSPKEVEELLTTHPGIAQAYVVGIPDETWGEAGCAWIVPTGTQSLTERDVIEFAKQRIARFKVPKLVMFTSADDLPKTGTGKVQKAKLIARVVLAREQGRINAANMPEDQKVAVSQGAA